ncbi:hypothetical protein ASPZODRAFT_97019 [Penicilliopsis zonata CBS 506.65]|uniref:NAD(P)-binding domain-containing protein n=1 Tax=Penicilliopsis zonata CBS 506.65 TaxID=1073090 RepID=A0A1L9SHN9_9EURO|nr:hypothetical protein ASPZODRAFT_97019 [Penicilliopsis zonata CBS 506.65]OJJ46647.1 hypothetical protein ASPZODRAFT_97019 [Penicilliopsis zonata CBS 506.65]
MPRVLLLGGHGNVAMAMTPLFLARSWSVTSVIRNPEHENEILALAKGQPGHLDVLLSSLDDVRCEADAQAILDTVSPDYVVWAAGAGGKGSPDRTIAIDQNAAKFFISTAFASKKVSKILLISHLGSRRCQPSWMSDGDWGRIRYFNEAVLPVYYRAKLEADEYMTALARKKQATSGSFQSILLRPGLLADGPATREVQLGKTRAEGSVTREDVAIVADKLLAREDTHGWYDLLNGEEPVDEAVERVVRDKVDAVDGEDVDAMVARFN